MKRTIILGLGIFSLMFVIGVVYIISSIERSTSSLDELIILHQVEILRGLPQQRCLPRDRLSKVPYGAGSVRSWRDMGNFRKINKAVLGFCLLLFFVAGIPAVYAGVASAQDDWMKKFADICSKTQDAMTFTVEQLKDLVVRCDRLKAQTEKMEETQKKVYLKRLQMCGDLFAFVLETKEKK